MARPGLDRRHHDFQQLLAPDDRAGPVRAAAPMRTGQHSARLVLARRGTTPERTRVTALRGCRFAPPSRRELAAQRDSRCSSRLSRKWGPKCLGT
jgi:hypothetical protein